MMKFNSKSVILKNGQSIVLRSAVPEDSENMLEHLKTTLTESYKNMNQSADFWKSLSVADEQKILADFENSKNKFMLIAVSDNRIIGGCNQISETAFGQKIKAPWVSSIKIQ